MSILPIMWIWIVFAALTALATLSVLAPLRRKPAVNSGVGGEQDMAVYRQQLQEVERDLERGVIDAPEAESARIEISRRLLTASRENSSETEATLTAGDGRRAKVVQWGALVVIPLATVGLYLFIGSPDAPDQPLAGRLANASASQDVGLLVSRVENHLAQNPGDARGWDIIAPVYMRLGETEKAVQAYRNAIRLAGSDLRRETDLGEALAMAANGVITAEAQAAFERALAIDSTAVKPRFFMALALGQEGRREQAIAAWTALLADAQGGEAWVSAARVELAKLDPDAAALQAPSPSGPSQQDVAAASEMTPEDRTAMIRGMVEGLAERLAREGGGVEQWERLLRAYGVLNDRPAFDAAMARARAAFVDDPAATTRLEALEKAIYPDDKS